MRRSGDTIFADVTISTKRRITKFLKKAHEISNSVEKKHLKRKYQMQELQFILNPIGKMFHWMGKF
jgi:hypothetical protein